MQADARKVKQIVYNLLSNAVKFTPDGGQVTLRARSRRARRRRPRCRAAGRAGASVLADSDFTEFLEISVTDTGIGISPEELRAACSSRSARSTAAWRGNSRAPGSAWRW